MSSFFLLLLYYIKHKIIEKFSREVKLQPFVSSYHSKFVRKKYINKFNSTIFFVIGTNIYNRYLNINQQNLNLTKFYLKTPGK